MSIRFGKEPTPERPEILAPAGDVSCFLAAVAAGADNIYLGLKQFSARMQAENFGFSELYKLTNLAHESGTRVTVAMNTIVKQHELAPAYRLIHRLEHQTGVDGIIVQDLAMLDMARQAGFSGEITLSTLANLTHPESLIQAKKLGASKVVLPRELSIDEIRMMGDICPDDLTLECFIHGALCYCVSGRCYWSSYMGGKSGLRGRCVQPCRRVYSQGPSVVQNMLQRYQRDADGGQRKQGLDRRASKYPNKGWGTQQRQGAAQQEHQQGKPARVGHEQSGRYFSCQDLSIDVLCKTITGIPHLVTWKIEGRKKGPHYVYHAVAAYKLLRDNPGVPEAKKMAEDYLEMALGRPGTKAKFLPQRETIPVNPAGQTSSGLLVGKISIDRQGSPCIKPHIPLQPGDYLRVGVEDENWHTTLPVSRFTPKGGTLVLRIPKHKTPKMGVSVYLIDRREKDLSRILNRLQARLDCMEGKETKNVESQPSLPSSCKKEGFPAMTVHASLPQGKETRGSRKFLSCLWMTHKSVGLSRTVVSNFGWWLPPVIWPEEERSIRSQVTQLWRGGARTFVCNAPWQIGFFDDAMLSDKDSRIIAGPFCNITNSSAVGMLKGMGFKAAIVSPELAKENFLELPSASPLPLGVVLSGFWPVGLSRFGTLGVRLNEPFASPKGEAFWARQYGENTWIYPAWQLNLTEQRYALEKAGYSFTVSLQENAPASLPESKRPGLFNWDGELL